MFYLVGHGNKLVRQSESRMALRRIRRKSTAKEQKSLRIIEGRTLGKALKSESKVAKVVAPVTKKASRKSHKARKSSKK